MTQIMHLAASHAVGEFLGWLPRPENMPGSSGPYTCLFDYIEAWLVHGTAVQDCCEEFPTFLAAVVLIIAEWHEGFQPPEDYSELTALTKIMDPEHTSYWILSPDAFMMARQAFRAERWRELDR